MVGKKTNIRAGINDKKSLLFWRILFTVYMIVLVIVLVLKFPTSLVINSVKSWSNSNKGYTQFYSFEDHNRVCEKCTQPDRLVFQKSGL